MMVRLVQDSETLLCPCLNLLILDKIQREIFYSLWISMNVSEIQQPKQKMPEAIPVLNITSERKKYCAEIKSRNFLTNNSSHGFLRNIEPTVNLKENSQDTLSHNLVLLGEIQNFHFNLNSDKWQTFLV